MRPHYLATIVVLAASAAAAQGPKDAVSDAPGLLGPAGMSKVLGAVSAFERDRRVPVTVRIVDALNGENLDEATVRYAKASGRRGVFILVTKQDHKLNVVVSKEYEKLVPAQATIAVRDAMIPGFKNGDFAGGIIDGLKQIDRVVATSERSGVRVPPREAELATIGPPPASGELVTRNRVGLTLAGARAAVAAAEHQAAQMKLKVNIAVVDDGGHLLHFTRMDGARPASVATSITKAVTAATMRAPSGPTPPGTTTPDPLLNLSLQNAAAASGGKLTTLYGGIPILIDGQVAGAIGVGGATGEQDAEIARAGAKAVVDALGAAGKNPD